MPRFVNLPTTNGNEESVRVDRIESVRHNSELVTDFIVNTDKSSSVIVIMSGRYIHVALPKPKVMELLGLHLTGNGEEWV